jgi:hypothetical protein
VHARRRLASTSGLRARLAGNAAGRCAVLGGERAAVGARRAAHADIVAVLGLAARRDRLSPS